DYSQELVENGFANYTEVITARQSLLQAELASIDDRLQPLRATIDLYRSLGGGWKAWLYLFLIYVTVCSIFATRSSSSMDIILDPGSNYMSSNLVGITIHPCKSLMIARVFSF